MIDVGVLIDDMVFLLDLVDKLSGFVLQFVNLFVFSLIYLFDALGFKLQLFELYF
jgi:hypothetical protein